uniref:Uncharacterized protein n=1 Tax=Alexandrium catenella TaxID=2925 RepID=A0A7S1WVF9_ALECA
MAGRAAAPPPLALQPEWRPRAAVAPGRPSRETCGTWLAAGLGGGFFFQGAAANKFSMNVEEVIVELVPLPETVAAVVLALAGCIGSIWAWSLYLETRPSFEQMRGYMLAMLAAVTAYEMSLCLTLDVHWWMCPLVLVANAWGLLDAVVRFPVVHDLDTPFSVKQLALLLCKVAACAFGFVDVHGSKVSIFTSLLVNIIAMPLIYFLALPLEEEEAAAPAGRVVDVDIAVRLVQILSDTQERQEFLLGFRRRARVSLAWLARTSPCTAEVLVRADPSMKKVVWKNSDI